jgi:large repetitive protein
MESWIMPLSYNSIVGGGSNASNDFTVSLGTSGNTRVPLSTEFPAGTYTVTSSLSDSILDIYLIATDGTSAGYVNASAASFSITATKAFDVVVILGGTNNDTISFVFEYVFTPNANSTDDTSAAPATVTSISASSLPNQNNTTDITGRNFASDVTVTFIGSDNVSRSAKSIVRNSSTSLTVTRPDTLPTQYAPYTIVVANPSIPAPTSTNQHRLSGAVTVGAAPAWVTAATLPTFFPNLAYSTTLSATDSDGGSSVTYSVISGSLPSSMTLNSSTGVISGTSTSASAGSFTIRATDSGNNTVDRAFTMPRQTVPNAPTSVTASKTSTIGRVSVAFTAPTQGYTPTSYTVTSSPGGITATGSSSPILVNGLTGGTTYTFTVTSTSAEGTSSASSASNSVAAPTTLTQTFNTSGTWTNPGVSSVEALVVGGGGGGGYGHSSTTEPYGGGGGAGGVLYSASLAINANSNYSVTVGNGGGGSASGNSSTFANLTALGGERGTDSSSNTKQTATSGFGSGGGGSSAPNNAQGAGTKNQGGNGTSGQGTAGSNGTSSWAGGGGGSLTASPNSSGNTTAQAYYGVPGNAVTYFGSKYAAGGAGANPYSSYAADGIGGGSGNPAHNGYSRPNQTTPTAGTNGTGSGGGAGCGLASIHNSNVSAQNGAAGGNGVVVLRYVA